MSEDKTYKIGRFDLHLPANHLLGAYQSRFNLYDVALGEIARLVVAKYREATAIDIGANVGDSAALICRHQDLPVLCIEGHPLFASYLRRNLANLPRCIVIVECFVGAIAGSTAAESVQTKGGTASLSSATTAGAGTLPVRRLVDILRDHPQFGWPRLVKTDTDGGDFDIIRSSLEVLRECLPVLYFEYDPSSRGDGVASAARTIAGLVSVGYRFFIVYDNFGNFMEIVRTDVVNRFRDLSRYLISHAFFGKQIYYLDVCAFSSADEDLAVQLYNLHSATIDERMGQASRPESDAIPFTEMRTCRLCGADVAAAFERQVLSKHNVKYYRCSGCGSLQTEQPHWLDEAYAGKVERFDTGKASRTIFNFLTMPQLLEILGVRKTDRALDFGGGTGLFSRLMRDLGYDFYSFDKYGSGEFMGGYTWELGRKCYLITMFEVAEHFAEPMDEWKRIFSADPEVVIGSTEIFTGQGLEWNYLTPESGQHVFFYSSEAIAYLAGKFGRHAYNLGLYFLIAREPLSVDAQAKIVIWRDNIYTSCERTLREWAPAPYVHASRDLGDIVAVSRLRQTGTRIAVDGVFFRLFATGIARVWISLLAEWSASGFGEFLVVIDHDRTAPRYPGITYVDAPPTPQGTNGLEPRQMQEICDRERISLFISTYYSTPVSTPAVMMVHDMIPEVLGFDLSDHVWKQKHRAIDYARSFISVSKNTAKDLIRFFPRISESDVVISHNGTSFRTASIERVAAFKNKFGIDRPYFMISGGRRGYKNTVLFFKAFERLGDSRSAYSILCSNDNGALEAEFAAYVGEARVHMLVLSDADLECAYSAALALVYPSRYEGFGLPVLEAMACSCPVITCRASAIPEVGGDAVIYVDPNMPDQMFGALQRVQIETTRGKFIVRGLEQAARFSWTKMAREVRQVLTQKALDVAAGKPESPMN